MERITIDANVVLRYILKDNEAQAKQAQEVIESGKSFLLPEVLAEVVYVLSFVYKVPRELISNTLISIIDNISCENPNVLLCALDLYANKNLDFVDCLLVAYYEVNNETIFSFDKKVSKLTKK